MIILYIILLIVIVVLCIRRDDGVRSVRGGGDHHWTKTCQEPWWSMIKSGRKRIEGRLARDDIRRMQPFDTLTLIRAGPSRDPRASFDVTIVEVKIYKTFREYLEKEGVENCLPGVASIDDGIAIYRQWSTPSDEARYGVAAIHVRVQ